MRETPYALAPRWTWLTCLIWAALVVGLYAHARVYDFFADDAYIALRYSQSLIERGELTYNPGERVEGFTSPLWVLLVALLGVGGGSLSGWAQALGLITAVGTLYKTVELWKQVAPKHPVWAPLVTVALLVASPSFAAWAMGGLEAPLFALCLTASLVAIGRARSEPTLRRFVVCGVWCAVASLARPEGMALVALGTMLAGADAIRRKNLALWGGFLAPVVVLLGGYLVFRLTYYGYPLPNTYYVKTSGGRGLTKRGLGYVWALSKEYGAPFCVALVFSMLAPLLRLKSRWEHWRRLETQPLLHLLMRGIIAAFLLYLVRIGGDFLDLYRFVVPILPAMFVVLVATGLEVFREVRSRFGQSKPYAWGLLLMVALLVADHSRHQLWMATRTLYAKWYKRPKGAPKKPRGVESISFTREAGLQWAALGRALRDVAEPGDTLATGAAGAAPFTSNLPNLDLFGLNDEWVAHHGKVVGNRPGHQRWAGEKYILKKKPTFLFAGELYRDFSRKPQAHKYWSKHGYVSAEIAVDKDRYNAAETFYQTVFVRKHRVEHLKSRPEWRFESKKPKGKKSKGKKSKGKKSKGKKSKGKKSKK